MTHALGYGAIVVAFGMAIYGMVAAVLGVRRKRPGLIRSAALAAFGIFILMTISNLTMVYALVVRDFSVSYVAQVGSRATPLLYTVISLWGALEGSILLWAWVLSGYTAAVVYLNREQRGSLVPYATATLLGVGAFFYLLLLLPANPFGTVMPVPLDGPGPNPLLQNHILMAVHPPLLYLGFVGLTVPFAFAVGALLSGRLTDSSWIRITRRWTIAAWGFLSLAIIAGMWWSYEVLGWGGYWAWDPVENASFLPWLTATAFLHSARVEERSGALRVWNLTLIMSTFLLTILGTFLTRSGIVSSVHAFAEGEIGIYFLAFIALVLLFSLALLLGRGEELSTPGGRIDGVVSRESVFLVNNLLLAAFTFTVLLGTLFPLVAEAVRGVRVSVGAPFFNRMTMPLCMALLFLMGVGPSLPWRQARREDIRGRFRAPAIAAIGVAALTIAFGARGPYTILAFTFAAWAMVTNLAEFQRGAALRMRAHGESALQALVRLFSTSGGRYGGYVAHIGIILVAVGIAASSSFRVEEQATLRLGETMAFEEYELRLESIEAIDEPQRLSVRAEISILDEDAAVRGTLDPRLNFYPTSDQPIATPAVRERPSEDLYLTLMAFEEDGSGATIQAVAQPLVVWIWIGGLLVGLGALLSLLATRRKRPGPPRRRFERAPLEVVRNREAAAPVPAESRGGP